MYTRKKQENNDKQKGNAGRFHELLTFAW